METLIGAKARQATMTIAYEKGERVVTHPTGVVSKTTIEDLESQKNYLLGQKKQVEDRIAQIDIAIIECAKAT